MIRSTFKPKRPMKRSPFKLKRTRIKKVGRRTKDWRAVWRFLKPRLEAAGRTRCEFYFIKHDCGLAITPAHSKKRRLMQGADIYVVAIACLNAHRELDERMTHADMEVAVWRAINENGGLILPEERKAA